MGALLGVTSFFVMVIGLIMYIVSGIKKRSRKKTAILIAVAFCVFLITSMIGIGSIESSEVQETLDPAESVDNKEETGEGQAEVPADPAWKMQFSPELVSEIEGAFTEIGEDPDNIVSVEYDSIRETDLFDQRSYAVEFSDTRENIAEVFDGDKIGWIHHKTYLITTEEWHEGEPERVQNPGEYLITIKFWDGKELTTNLNQWTHTGNGEMQGR